MSTVIFTKSILFIQPIIEKKIDIVPWKVIICDMFSKILRYMAEIHGYGVKHKLINPKSSL